MWAHSKYSLALTAYDQIFANIVTDTQSHKQDNELLVGDERKTALLERVRGALKVLESSIK